MITTNISCFYKSALKSLKSCTINAFDEMERPIGVGLVELSYPDLELIAVMTAVVEEKLQALKSSSRIKNPALQQCLVPRQTTRCAKVHEITPF